MRQGDRVEGEVPGRVPGVLPLVRHRDDVAVDHVEPVAVAQPEVRCRRAAGGASCSLEPGVDVEEVVLLGPEHAGEGLAHHERGVGRERRRGERGVEGVGLGAAGRENPVEVRERRGRARRRRRRQAQADARRAPGGHAQAVVRGRLGARPAPG